jgi:CheY-like chemotaxis protein
LSQLEQDLRYLGVLEKAQQITAELGQEAAIRYIRHAYRLLSKVYHPDLHQENRRAAEEGQRRLNALKQRLDAASDEELGRFLKASTRPRAGRPRVLVVDDEIGLADNLGDLLVMEGYQVATTPDGLSGLRLHLSFRPELVITDILMPIMDGVEMVRTLRQRDPEIKVIFVSGFFGTHSIQNSLMRELARFGYPSLAKPFRPSQLLEMVRRELGG